MVTSTYKARGDSLSRLSREFPDRAGYWRRLYLREGVRVRGYYYLRPGLRKALLRPVVGGARRLGLTYATCREGLTTPEFFNAPSCDGTHLLRKPLKARRGIEGG